MTLIEFLLARIAEDEDAANIYAKHHDPTYIYSDGVLGWPDGVWADGSPYLTNRHNSYTVLYDPARVTAECAAKRVMIRTLRSGELRALASVYSDHEDYRQEWAA